MPEHLRDEHVRHLADLAMLRLTDEEIEQFREQLSSIIAYEKRLDELTLDEVEPLTRPEGDVNRLAEDQPEDSLPLEVVERNAPAMLDGAFLVPRVLDDSGGA